jgi:uncharacterized protein (TIGR00730 family)
MNITVYCGSSFGNRDSYRAAAQELGQWIGSQGHTLVFGGGKIGLMGTLADAVLASGGRVIGVIPEFLHTPGKTHTGLTALYTVPSMAQRKAKMIELGEAFIALPGGPGTLEEISEVISLRRLGKTDAPCFFYNVDGYYDLMETFFQQINDREFLAYPYTEIVHFPTSLAELAAHLPAKSGNS